MPTGVIKKPSIVTKPKVVTAPQQKDPEPPPMPKTPEKKKDAPMPPGYPFGIDSKNPPYVFGEKVITLNNFLAINNVPDHYKGATVFNTRIGPDGKPIVRITSNLALYNGTNNPLDMDEVKQIYLLHSHAYVTNDLKNGSYNGIIRVETVLNVRQITNLNQLTNQEILVEVTNKNNPGLVGTNIVKAGNPPVDTAQNFIADGMAHLGGAHILINYDSLTKVNGRLNVYDLAWIHEWFHAAIGLEHDTDPKNVLYKFSERNKEGFRDKEIPEYQNGITIQQLIRGMDNYASGSLNKRKGFTTLIDKSGNVLIEGLDYEIQNKFSTKSKSLRF